MQSGRKTRLRPVGEQSSTEPAKRRWSTGFTGKCLTEGSMPDTKDCLSSRRDAEGQRGVSFEQ